MLQNSDELGHFYHKDMVRVMQLTRVGIEATTVISMCLWHASTGQRPQNPMVEIPNHTTHNNRNMVLFTVIVYCSVKFVNNVLPNTISDLFSYS